MRVKCLTQEHNAVPRPGLEPRLFDPESSALTIRPSRLPLVERTEAKLHSGHSKYSYMKGTSIVSLAD